MSIQITLRPGVPARGRLKLSCGMQDGGPVQLLAASFAADASRPITESFDAGGEQLSRTVQSGQARIFHRARRDDAHTIHARREARDPRAA